MTEAVRILSTLVGHNLAGRATLYPDEEVLADRMSPDDIVRSLESPAVRGALSNGPNVLCVYGDRFANGRVYVGGTEGEDWVCLPIYRPRLRLV